MSDHSGKYSVGSSGSGSGGRLRVDPESEHHEIGPRRDPLRPVGQGRLAPARDDPGHRRAVRRQHTRLVCRLGRKTSSIRVCAKAGVFLVDPGIEDSYRDTRSRPHVLPVLEGKARVGLVGPYPSKPPLPAESRMRAVAASEALAPLDILFHPTGRLFGAGGRSSGRPPPAQPARASTALSAAGATTYHILASLPVMNPPLLPELRPSLALLVVVRRHARGSCSSLVPCSRPTSSDARPCTRRAAPSPRTRLPPP